MNRRKRPWLRPTVAFVLAHLVLGLLLGFFILPAPLVADGLDMKPLLLLLGLLLSAALWGAGFFAVYTVCKAGRDADGLLAWLTLVQLTLWTLVMITYGALLYTLYGEAFLHTRYRPATHFLAFLGGWAFWRDSAMLYVKALRKAGREDGEAAESPR